MEVLPRNSVLIFGQETDELHPLQGLLNHLTCSVAIANSADQAVQQASQLLPALVILTGDRTWSPALINELRQISGRCGTTIVVLTEVHAPSWLEPDNELGVDGYLVNPIGNDILASLIQSAWVRQKCCFAALNQS